MGILIYNDVPLVKSEMWLRSQGVYGIYGKGMRFDKIYSIRRVRIRGYLII